MGDDALIYAPLSRVWEGSDRDLLEQMFTFYASIPPEPILDATYNAGRFWKNSTRHVVSMDNDPRYKPMIVGDNRTMEGVADAAYGAVVYDPPHVGPQPCFTQGNTPHTRLYPAYNSRSMSARQCREAHARVAWKGRGNAQCGTA